MTRNHSCHLLDMLAEVPDPRKKKGLRHPLQAMLGALVVGLLCGHKGYTCIATWKPPRQPTLAKALGFKRRKTPSGSTFHNLLKALDVNKLEQTLTKWVMATYQRCPFLESRLTAVAIDGKSLHGTDTQESRRLHLLAAASHELGIPLTQCAVGEETNEISVASKLLKRFDVAGKVITTEVSLLTQRAFCKDILTANADYALPVKANQKQLFEDIRDLFEPLAETDPPEVNARRFEKLHPQAEAHLDGHTDVETAHGFTTTRTLRCSTLLTPEIKWPGLAQVYEYHIQRQHTQTEEITHYKQYGITSLLPEKATAEDLLKLRREHWSIENKLHWLRDVIFDEDASQARTGSIPHVMAALRNAAISVLRFTGRTKISQTLREFADRPKLAVNLIQS